MKIRQEAPPRRGAASHYPQWVIGKELKKMGTRAQVGGTPFALFTAEAK